MSNSDLGSGFDGLFGDFFKGVNFPVNQPKTVYRVMTHDLKENVITVLHQGYLSLCNANAARDIFRTFTEEDMQKTIGFTFNAAAVYVDSVQK